MGQQEEALAMMQKREAAEKRIEDRKNGVVPKNSVNPTPQKSEPPKADTGGLIRDIIISIVFALVVTGLVLYFRPLY